MRRTFESRIDLNDDWAIAYDGIGWKLIEKKIITGVGKGSHLVKPENIGKRREYDYSYPATLTDALGAFVKVSLGANISSIEEIIPRLNGIQSEITLALEKHKDQIITNKYGK